MYGMQKTVLQSQTSAGILVLSVNVIMTTTTMGHQCFTMKNEDTS